MSSNRNNSPKGNSNVKRSSLISIKGKEKSSTTVHPTSEVVKGKEPKKVQPDSVRERETHEKEKSSLKVIGIVPDRGKDDLGASNIESNKHPFLKILDDVGKPSTSSHAEFQGSRITNPHEKSESQLGVQMSHNKPRQRKTKKNKINMTNDSNKPDANLCRGDSKLVRGNLSNPGRGEGSLGRNESTYKNKKNIILPIKKDISNHLDWKGKKGR